jgi:PTS system mannose-specific IIA component
VCWHAACISIGRTENKKQFEKRGERMIGILLLTHEDFGTAMLKSAELIVGQFPQVSAIGLNRGDDIAVFSQKVEGAIQEMDTGDGVLVFVDLFGASPYNATALASSRIKQQFRCITGISFPMVLESLTMRETCSLEELTERCMESGKDGIKELFSELQRV